MGRVTAHPGAAIQGSRDPRRPFATSPFARLARTHAFGVAGDALFAIALAGSVFFNLDFNSARWRVALYLLLTIAPFAVAAPLIGPALDRMSGGRRWVLVGSMAARALLCVLVIRHLDSILFYPEAFLMLVLGKAYTISKSAVVPTTVRSDTELVEANSKLTVLSAIAVVVAVLPGGVLLKLGGPGWTLGLAVIAFGAATAMALQLPAAKVAVEPPGEMERMELRSAAIFLASIGMGTVRGIVGFLVFMLAFDFKNAGAPAWHLGVSAAAAQLGFFIGAATAPHLRKLADEERILAGNLLLTCLAGVLCALIGGLAAAALLPMIVGATSSAAKQAFDAIIQRDAPDANRGRSFARFETRFQLYWVIGALIPIVVPIPAELGFAAVALAAGAAAGWYLLGLWRIRHGHVPARRRGVSVGARERAVGRRSPQRPDTFDQKSGSWEPPPGFVSQRLDDDLSGRTSGATAVDRRVGVDDAPLETSRPSPAPERATGTGSTVVQPTLPLDDTYDYPEPRWREPAAPPAPSTGGPGGGDGGDGAAPASP
jgi:hypothetical protein